MPKETSKSDNYKNMGNVSDDGIISADDDQMDSGTE